MEYFWNVVVVIMCNCPTNVQSCPMGVIVGEGYDPRRYLSLGKIGNGKVVLGGNCPTG